MQSHRSFISDAYLPNGMRLRWQQCGLHALGVNSLCQQMDALATCSLAAGCTAFVHPTGLAPRLHRCTKIGRTRAESAPNCAEVDIPGISIAEIVGGVVLSLFAIAGAVILCKTWRALAVKRGDRNHREPLLTANVTGVVILGGGTGAATAAAAIGVGVVKEVCEVCACLSACA